MKKIRLVLLAAALMSAFTFSSCLDDEETQQEYMSLVTIDYFMGSPVMYPDENPQQQFFFAGDLTQYGIPSSATRALITYTVAEEFDWTTPQVEINLVSGGCSEWAIKKITDLNHVDTCATHTSAITAFSYYGVGNIIFPALNIVRDRYMNVGYNYQANKLADLAMVPNRISNDTVYFDMKIKKEGDNLSSGAVMDSWDLHSVSDFWGRAMPKEDSLYVTVVALTSEYSEEKDAVKDSVTTRFKPF